MNPATTSYNSTGTRDQLQAMPISLVFEELQKLESTQSTTHDLINELEQRLEAILTAPYPNEDTLKGVAPASRLHGALQERSANSVGHNGRLAQLLSRLTI
jgi:hypothetical protein